MDHGKAMERAVRKIRRGFGAEPGLATNNAGVLLPKLREWGVEVPYLLTSIHPRGYGMRPTQAACAKAFRDFSGKIVASLDVEFSDNIAANWRDQSVHSAVYDESAPNLKQWRQWSGWKESQIAAERERRVVEVA
jgi:hypothetical protein